ncbi:hypothetical protein [Pseudomonas sp. MS19]|uniref:hypothetical protein n=1 Tax=Pseudomonas sp. MS19 TaxID=2579939 RepID=UPI0015625062|nr:hypothetical protein [Pseudomonas sp. MS19]NRH26582.1 hypothetical protein [Pseudomonas sp. MS19]
MKHCELFRPLILPGLLRTEVPTDRCDFKNWISSGNYLLRGISSNSVDIEVNNDYAFNHMIAYDSCRMATAAFETMHNIQSSTALPKSIGWIAIKSYYAAFFSAHSIMRCFGYTCSQLEKGHAMQLNGYAQTIGLAQIIKAEAGFFSGVYDRGSRIHRITKMKNTHEDTWATLNECLKKVSRDILMVTGLSVHKQQVSASLTDIVFKLTDKGRLVKGNYLSQFRNAVNYRQEHDLWHPYGKNSIQAEKVVTYLASWKDVEDMSTAIWKESLEAYNFFVACRDVVNLNYLLIRLVIESSENSSNLYKRWPAKLLNIAAI